MRERMPGTSLVLFLVCVLSSRGDGAGEGEAAPEKEPDPAVKQFGVLRGEPVNRGFFFYDGRYVEPPYVVERRGLAIYANDLLLRPGEEWPPYDYRVPVDPGEPPADAVFAPLEPPKDQDPRDRYWTRKRRYLFQHFEEKEAHRLYLETLRRSPLVKRVDDTGPRNAIVYLRDGREVPMSTATIGRFRRRTIRTAEEALTEAEHSRKFLQTRFESGGLRIHESAGGSMSAGDDAAVGPLRALATPGTPAERETLLLRAGPKLGVKWTRKLAAPQPTPAFIRRVELFAKLVALDGPRPEPEELDFDRLEKRTWWRFTKPRRTVLRTNAPDGIFLDLDRDGPPVDGKEAPRESEALKAWAKRQGVDAWVRWEGGEVVFRAFALPLANSSIEFNGLTPEESRETLGRVRKLWVRRPEFKDTFRLLRYRPRRNGDGHGSIIFETSSGTVGALTFDDFQANAKEVVVRSKHAVPEER